MLRNGPFILPTPAPSTMKHVTKNSPRLNVLIDGNCATANSHHDPATAPLFLNLPPHTSSPFRHAPLPSGKCPDPAGIRGLETSDKIYPWQRGGLNE